MRFQSIAGGLGAALLACSAAEAAVIVTTYEGTVDIGTTHVGDVFGTLPSHTLPFTAVFVVDTDLGTRDTTATYDRVAGSFALAPITSAALTINGVTYSFDPGNALALVQGGSYVHHSVSYADFDGIGVDNISFLSLSAMSLSAPFSLETPYDLTSTGAVLNPSFGIGVHDNSQGKDLAYVEGFFTVARAYTAQAPVSAIPEPSTWALMLVGIGGAGAMLRRQRVLA